MKQRKHISKALAYKADEAVRSRLIMQLVALHLLSFGAELTPAEIASSPRNPHTALPLFEQATKVWYGNHLTIVERGSQTSCLSIGVIVG
jgi:hypothetical protein